MLDRVFGHKSVECTFVLHQSDGVESQGGHLASFEKLNGIAVALVARSGACSFMLCDLDFEPLSLSLSSMPSCDLVSLTNMLILLHYLESFKSELAEVFVFKS
ncbi:hypothetical protein Tco_0765480 [Tanacetum coccineum]